MEKILDTIFPPKCFGCGVGYGHICRSCLSKCNLARHHYCVVCDKPSFMGETHDMCKTTRTPASIFSTYEYKGLVRKCIMRSKYKAKLFAPLKVLSQEAADIASKCDQEYEGFVVVPIPLSKKRVRERGFNQAGIIAQAVARRFALVLGEELLVRGRETAAQHKKTRQDRFKSMRDAFQPGKGVKNMKILLVDDICTTGATLLEASRTLLEAEAKEVKCFTLAKEF